MDKDTPLICKVFLCINICEGETTFNTLFCQELKNRVFRNADKIMEKLFNSLLFFPKFNNTKHDKSMKKQEYHNLWLLKQVMGKRLIILNLCIDNPLINGYRVQLAYY